MPAPEKQHCSVMDVVNILRSPVVPATADTDWLAPQWLAAYHPAATVLMYQGKLSPAQETLAKRLLEQGCGLLPEAYTLVELPADTRLSWPLFKTYFQCKNVLLCGILPRQIGISALFAYNRPNHFDSATIIPTATLAEMDQQVAHKKQLFTAALQPVFKQ